MGELRDMFRWAAALLFFLCVAGASAPDEADVFRTPLGLKAVPWPDNNPYSREKAELGRLLFFDARLSADFSLSCATCHSPRMGFSDAAPVSTGIRGQKGTRRAPTVLNSAYNLALFWDGRASTLEEQVKGPVANPIEMGASHEVVVSRLGSIAAYRDLFQRAFGDGGIDIERVSKAIATFERTVLSGNSAYDRYQAGDKKAMTASQIHGMDVFKKAKCDKCHEGNNFTDNKFHNLGVGTDAKNPDTGRFGVTGDPKDWGAFKTPTLRDVASVAPYLHDGSKKNLRQVVEFYDEGCTPNKNLDPDIKRLKLSDRDKEDLVEFLRALSGEGWQNIKPPERTPE
jgi:cytochrome c peroxidase